MKDYPKLTETLSIKVTSEMKIALQEFARSHDTTEGAVIRDLLQRHIVRERPNSPRRTTTAELAQIVECAEIINNVLSSHVGSWEELLREMKYFGIEYYERGGGLAVRWITDKPHICKASEAGPGYAELIKRFQTPFPGHRHVRLANRVLVEK